VEPSPAEQTVMRLVRRAKLFVWLRAHRHELFDDDFQAELAAAYQQSPKGQPPVPPAQLGLATVLQAYTGASDDEVVEATVMDRRWQVVLDCLDAERPPFSKGTLVGFRARLIAHGLDRRLVERTVALAKSRGGFGDRALRAALDASPLWGAGRVEDTINLLGHALRKALGVIARQQGRGLSWNQGIQVMATEVNVSILAASSLKAALDRDWDDPVARDQALGVVLAVLEQVEAWWPTTGSTARGSRRRLGRLGRSAIRTSRWPMNSRRRSSVGSPGTGGSPSRTRRCATAARVAAT
jgi:transposase